MFFCVIRHDVQHSLQPFRRSTDEYEIVGVPQRCYATLGIIRDADSFPSFLELVQEVIDEHCVQDWREDGAFPIPTYYFLVW